MRFPLAVGREVQRAIAEHATRPFVLGYRISPEEPGEGALRIGDAYMLIDRLIEAGIDYIHASLFDIPNAKPQDHTGERTTAELIAEHVAGRVPLIAAGQIRTSEQAQMALATGLSLVAIGQGLVLNPNWVEFARESHLAEIATVLNPPLVPQLAIPDKLWGVIKATKGWFPLVDEVEAAE
ncbi:2,4-dienoyl-CoA reductase-like NADH-dependent reductase (Old Yellow Enzyme family) [Paraburkholderia sp. MM6662-R1]